MTWPKPAKCLLLDGIDVRINEKRTQLDVS